MGNVLHNNPDADRYPCYKVVNSRGQLSERFAFGGIMMQQEKLESDGIIVENGRVDLERYQFRP